MKKNKESIFKGVISLLFSQIIIKIIGLLYKLYLTNREGFGDTGNAIYSSGFQIYALLLTFSSTGVPNAISKLVSQRMAVGDSKGAHNIFKIAFFIFSLFGAIGTIMLFLGAKTIAIKWLEIPEAEYSLITLSPSIFFVSITAVIRGYFNGRQSLTVTAKSQTIEQIFKTFFTIIFVEIVAILSKCNTVLMAGAANLATTGATLVGFSYIYLYYKSKRKEIFQEIKGSVNYTPTRIRKTIKEILKESVPISLTALMSSFNKNIDLFTIVKSLKKFMSESEAKIQYGILSGKVDMLCILPLSLNVPFVTAMVPKIAKEKTKDMYKELEESIKKFLQITILIGFPSTIGLIIFAKPIFYLLFPNATDGVYLLQVNSMSIIFAMMAQTVNAILQGIGKNNLPVFSFFIGMIFKIILNVVLVGKENIGIIGASIGNIVCNLIVFVIGIIVVVKTIHVKFNKKDLILKPMISVFFMSVISMYTYLKLKSIISVKVATIVALWTAIVIYGVSIIVLKIAPIFETIQLKAKKLNKFF